MKQFSSWLDNAKIRASYGVTGNNNVGDYVTVGSADGPVYVAIDGKEQQDSTLTVDQHCPHLGESKRV